MKKLSLDQVNFIENYLIKNKVKYWDVRLELLDHIATDVEQRMQKGQDSEEALKGVHLSFGNKYKSKRLNPERTDWIFNESLYADNSGYKKLIQERIISNQKELLKSFKVEIKKFFSSPQKLLMYPIVLIGVGNLNQLTAHPRVWLKVLFFTLIISACIPIVHALVFLRRSLTSTFIISTSFLPMLAVSLLNIFLNGASVFGFNEAKPISAGYVVFVLAFVLPVLVVEVQLYFKQCKKNSHMERRLKLK